MTIEEIVKDFPFTIDTKKYRNKEELLAGIDRHFSILAVKAETLGDNDLCRAADIMRRLMPVKLYQKASTSDEEEWKWVLGVLDKYEDLYSDDELSDYNLLVEEIKAALWEYEGKIKEVVEAAESAREKEKEFREKYGKPSGLMQEDFYLGTSDHWNSDDDM